MAIFKKEKKAEAEAEVPLVSGKKEVKKTATAQSVSRSALEGVLRRPHITEKASTLAEKNVYVFEVDKRANKVVIKQAIKDIYKVDPIKVNIVNSPSKMVMVKGKKGVKSGKKKAIVYLKKGDSIEII